jgi:hypothetical protein
MLIVAYKVTEDGGATIRYTANYGRFAGGPVPTGTRIYDDPIFRTFRGTAAANQYFYSGIIGAQWTQPIMTQDQLIPGGDLWALWTPNGTNYDPYRYSDGVLDQYNASGHRARPYPYRFYNSNPLIITSFRVCNANEDHVRNWRFDYSDDGDNWITLTSGTSGGGGYTHWTFTVPNSGAHQYYQFVVVTGTDGDWQNIGELTMYGTQNIVDDPVETVIGDDPGKRVYFFIRKENDQMRTYISVTGDHLPWSHYGGSFYTASMAPEGAYPLTQGQYDTLQYRIAAGDTIGWYANQRPYAMANWSQPVFTTYTASDGSTITAGNQEAGYGEYSWKAMDGITTGDNFWGTNVTATWWQVTFPHKIAITRLIHYNRNGADYANITGRYWTGPEMTNPIGAAFTLAGSWATRTVYNNAATAIITDKIYFQKTGGGVYAGIGEVVLTAKKISYEVPQ